MAIHEPYLWTRLQRHRDRPAISEGHRTFSSGELLERAEQIAASLLEARSDLAEERVAFRVPPGVRYAATLLGIWRAGGIAVPVSMAAKAPEIAHILSDTGAKRFILDHATDRTGLPDKVALLDVGTLVGNGTRAFPTLSSDRRAMILYTSGTTSRPKGVVTTHRNIRFHIESLLTAWEWSEDDAIPLFLPLHHVHGIINVLCCALASGAHVEVFPRFESDAVLARVSARAYSLFMAVPTIYAKILSLLENGQSCHADAAGIVEGFRAMRLNVSGSAALPATMHARWEDLTGQKILERYGMTETGMMISNPLHGERRPGHVGQPLPGVEIRLTDESGQVVANELEPGEIQVRGHGVFGEYWENPDATAASFVDDWFRTGDLAIRDRGSYRILGRLSVDIIKSGGYKISALEVESVLLDHPGIRECAVVGVDDETWGEVVVAVIVPAENADGFSEEDLRAWGTERMSPYKLPRRILTRESLPRNAMGKVSKKELVRLFS